jgi:hypothetical protein
LKSDSSAIFERNRASLADQTLNKTWQKARESSEGIVCIESCNFSKENLKLSVKTVQILQRFDKNCFAAQLQTLAAS